MSSQLASKLLPQLDELITRYEILAKQTKHDDFSDIDEAEASGFVTAGMAAIYRIAGPHSEYARQTEKIISKYPLSVLTARIPHVGGALKELRHALAAGYLDTIQELVHASVFADFIEMADYLLNDGYKDPAAVLIGGVLEEHLRKLCLKNSIQVEAPDSKGTMRPKKADTLNSELANGGIYSQLDQKNVTAWLDLRNKAAHARYTEYTDSQVQLFLQSVRDFIARYPA